MLLFILWLTHIVTLGLLYKASTSSNLLCVCSWRCTQTFANVMSLLFHFQIICLDSLNRKLYGVCTYFTQLYIKYIRLCPFRSCQQPWIYWHSRFYDKSPMFQFGRPGHEHYILQQFTDKDRLFSSSNL